jgi:cytoskeleton protein RodZ
MNKVTHLTADEHGGLNRRRLHLREISGDDGAALGTVGQELRAARLRRGDDLAAVSHTLKIRKDHLNALEDDKFEALPGRTYAVGFVRSYADYLGLDAVAAVERFKDEIAGRSDGSYQITPVPDTDERRLPYGWIVMAGVLVVIIAYAAYRLAISADALVGQPVAPVPARIAPRPPAAASTRPTVAYPLRSAAALPATTAATSPAGQHVAAVPANAKPAAGGASAKTGVSSASPGAAPPATPSPNSQADALPKGHEYGIQNTDARIILHVKALTRILVQGPDGKVLINRTLHPGDSYRIPDEEGLTLTTPNGGAVALQLDGQDVGVAGKDGQVTEGLSLDPQSLLDRFNQGSSGQGG